MPQPTNAISRWDLSLTYSEWSNAANRRRFAGHQLLPPLPVAMQNGKFPRFKAKTFIGPIEDTKRAPKGSYNSDTFEWDEDSYSTDEHGVKEPLDDREVKMYSDFINAEQIVVDRCLNRVLLAYEAAVAALLFNTSTFGNTAVGTIWTNKSGADPIADIDGIIASVETQCTERANTVAITPKALTALKRTDRVEDLLKYSGRDDPKNIFILSSLRDMFEVENVIIVGGLKNTAGRRQDASLAKIWDESMVLACRVDDGPEAQGVSPHIGRTFMWTEESATAPGADDEAIGVIAEQYRDEDVRGDVYRARTDYALKMLQAEAGHLLTGVT